MHHPAREGRLVHRSGGIAKQTARPSVSSSQLPKIEYHTPFQQTGDIFIQMWIGGRLDLLPPLKNTPRNTRLESQAASGNIHSLYIESTWKMRFNFSRWLFSYCFLLFPSGKKRVKIPNRLNKSCSSQMYISYREGESRDAYRFQFQYHMSKLLVMCQLPLTCRCCLWWWLGTQCLENSVFVDYC